MAYLLGLSWGKSLATASHWWATLLYLLLLLFYYMPANNQVFQAGETFVAFFMIIAVLWATSGATKRRRLAARPSAAGSMA